MTDWLRIVVFIDDKEPSEIIHKTLALIKLLKDNEYSWRIEGED